MLRSVCRILISPFSVGRGGGRYMIVLLRLLLREIPQESGILQQILYLPQFKHLSRDVLS